MTCQVCVCRVMAASGQKQCSVPEDGAVGRCGVATGEKMLGTLFQVIDPVSLFQGKVSFEQAIDLVMTQLDSPLRWEYWQSLTSAIGALCEKTYDEVECRSLYEAKQKLKFGNYWRAFVPNRDNKRFVSETEPTGQILIPKRRKTNAAPQGSTEGVETRADHITPKMFNPKEFQGKVSFRQAIDDLMTQVDAPMSWNYWKKMTAAIAKLYGKTYERSECRCLYEKKHKARFGNGCFQQAIDDLITQLDAPVTWIYWKELTAAIAEFYGKTYERSKCRREYEEIHKAKFGTWFVPFDPISISNRRSMISSHSSMRRCVSTFAFKTPMDT